MSTRRKKLTREPDDHSVTDYLHGAIDALNKIMRNKELLLPKKDGERLAVAVVTVSMALYLLCGEMPKKPKKRKAA